MTVFRHLVHPPILDTVRPGHLCHWVALLMSAGSVSRDAAPSTAELADLGDRALRLYERWELASGSLWITVEGDRVRRDLLEHLHDHPQLLVTDPAWGDRLVEMTVARATQVLLPAAYDLGSLPDPKPSWQITNEVTDMLHGRAEIRGAEIPAAITAPFVTACDLRTRYLDACNRASTPLGIVFPGQAMDEFPDDDACIEAENALRAFLQRHPELAGTREFADWYALGACTELRH